jgi:hypothetical protein
MKNYYLNLPDGRQIELKESIIDVGDMDLDKGFTFTVKNYYIHNMTPSDFINANIDWFDTDEVDELIRQGVVCCGAFDSEHCTCNQ